MLIFQLILIAASLYMSYRAYSNRPGAPSVTDNFGAPTVDEGTPVAVVFGTAWVTSPVIGWYGDRDKAPCYASGGGK